MPPVQQATYKGSDTKDYRINLKEIISKGSLGRLKRLKIGTTCVLTAALAKASPSPALVIDPCEPALKARKPKSRMRKPRQQKGIEWPEIPPVFVHRSVLAIYLGCLVMEVGVGFGDGIQEPGSEDDTARQGENSAGKMNHSRASKVSEAP